MGTDTTASVFGFTGYGPPVKEEFARQLAELCTERLLKLGQNMDTRDLRKPGDHNGATELAAGQCQTALTRAASVRSKQQLRTTMASRYGELIQTAGRAELARTRFAAELQRQQRQQRRNEEASASYTPPPQQSGGSSYGR
ncbi:hypothetical protein NJL88_26705 [Streptomyces sp. DK15]|uniref:hypothetical protein n=1 Tax=Streptomyces sp. DK15 TaxID=2957499 RepID=UPI0029BCB6A8|nr:hypothetical protein [Streptomyces sp. DK15]MDX2393585.1 hypothetical protein [Streptomyces sp. DK15]